MNKSRSDLNLSYIEEAVGNAGSSFTSSLTFSPMSFLMELVASSISDTDLDSLATSSIEAGAAGMTGTILSSSGAPTNGAAALRVADATAAISSTASVAADLLATASYFALRSAIFSVR